MNDQTTSTGQQNVNTGGEAQLPQSRESCPVPSGPVSQPEGFRWATYIFTHPEQLNWTTEEAYCAYRKEFPETL